MKTQNSRQIVKMLMAASLAFVASSAFSASTWNFGSCATPSTGCSADSGGITVNVSAWASTVGSSNTQFEGATLVQNGSGSGFSVKHGDQSNENTSPQHAMDNSGRQEFIALQFSQAVILDLVTIGWSNNDRDLTVMAYGGTGTPTLSGKTVANLASGWQLIEHVGDADGGSGYGDRSTNDTVSVNAAGVSSSWWLISAYNAGYNGSSSLDALSDYVKILSVANRAPGNETPEPGSLALIGAALMGLVAAGRRKAKTA
jgi:hypothetical protein